VTTAAPPDPATVRPSSLRWWREALYVAVNYAIYTVVRDIQGSSGSRQATITAFHHAAKVIATEKRVWLFHEHRVQVTFAGWRHFLQFWNIFYGTAHFIVTAAAIVWLFRRWPGRYPYWRNVLGIMTGLALVGFATFPLMPPRLLDAAGGHYGFVDTLARYGGSWSFDSDAMQRISNQYAAMPSLHFGWSSWCALVFYPLCRRRWTKGLALVYPFVTLFAIVVTANHFFLDAVAGAALLGLSMLIARPVTAWVHPRPV
jgi:hypothetical protein